MPSCATAISSASSPKPRAAVEAGLAALRMGAAWSRRRRPSRRDGPFAAWLKSQPVETTTVDERKAAASAPVARTIRRQYSRPFIAHASMAPSCAIAQWTGADKVQVWSHCQGVYGLRIDLSLALGLPQENIVVSHVEGAGCYGHNGADDVAFDAVLLARAAGGRPVRMQWSREDELAWSPMGAAMAVEIEADLDAQGDIVCWRGDVWSNGHVSRAGRAPIPTVLAASQLAKPFDALHCLQPADGQRRRRRAQLGSALRPARIQGHVPPAAHDADPHLGAAHARRLRQRVRHRVLHGRAGRRARRGPAWRSVCATSRTCAPAPCSRPPPGARDGPRDPSATASGYGIGFGRYKNFSTYCAVVAEVEAGGADIRVRRLVVAVDVGEVINPDGVANQMEGGAIQATSWTLKEAVRFDRQRVTSDTWETYPILRFSEVPAVDVEIVARPEEKAIGAGEAAHGPTAAAIGNAVFDALGVRVRDLPITRERIIAAMG